MHFATFYHPSVMDSTKLIEACGDRAVIILDGRRSDHHQISAKVCRERGYLAYQLHKGESFLRVSQSTEIYKV